MQCLRCGVDTETGCAHLECPHTEVYKQVLYDQQHRVIVASEPELGLESELDMKDHDEGDNRKDEVNNSDNDLNGDELEDHW